MAKYEAHLTGDFYAVLGAIHQSILDGSASAHFEDSSDWSCDDVQCTNGIAWRVETG